MPECAPTRGSCGFLIETLPQTQSAYASAGGSYSAAEIAELSKNARAIGGSGAIVAPPSTAGGGAHLGGIEIKKERKRKEKGGEAVKMKGLTYAPPHPPRILT